MKPLEIGLMLVVFLGASVGVVACTARETAKDAYTAQSEACVSIYSGDASAQKSCLDYVRAKWTKAGAPAAATDGGAE